MRAGVSVVVVSDPVVPSLLGRTGRVWRVTTGGMLWIKMDADLPTGMATFPAGDDRYRCALLRPEQVAARKPRTRRTK